MSHWRRTRMISFRVSEREFESLKAVSEARGARSVSDFARLALCRDGCTFEPGPAAELERLRGEIQALGESVRRLVELLEDDLPVLPSAPLQVVGRRGGGA